MAFATPNQNSGVRWSGLNDEKPWAVSPELQAKLDAAFVRALAAEEARIAIYAASKPQARKAA